MLLVHFLLSPPEGIQEFNGSHWIFPCLQIVEDPLQTKWDGLKVLDVCRHLVHCSSECLDDEEGLDQRVKVTGSAFVNQSVVGVLDRSTLATLGTRLNFAWIFFKVNLRFYVDTNV